METFVPSSFSRKEGSVEKLSHLLECLFVSFFILNTCTCQKSLDEEKKQHIEKAKELQKWVSNISKTLGDGEKAGKPLFSKQQVYSQRP